MTTEWNEAPEKVVRQLFSYDPESGRLYWRPRKIHRSWDARWSGKEALSYRDNQGYLSGTLFGKKYRAHRVAWLHYYGEWPEQVDHINGDRGDNRISNLRSVKSQDNCKNYGIPKDNKTGVLGVRKEPRTGKWTAQIRSDNKYKHLGTFVDFFEAVCARKRAELAMGFFEKHGVNLSWGSRAKSMGAS